MELHLYKTYEKIEDSHWWFVGRRKIVFDFLDQSGVARGKAKIFDFGCNTGNLVGKLQKQGYDAYGSDISIDAISFGKANGIKNIEIGEIGRMPFSDAKFDVIFALDVIEHIEDDEAALSTLKSMLAPKGKIVIMVPALPILWGLQDEVAHHFRRYTKKSLKALAEKADLKIARITYFNFFLFPPIAAVRLLQKVFKPFIKPKRGSDFELNNGFVNKILAKIFAAESNLLQYMNLLIGVSLLTILEKN